MSTKDITDAEVCRAYVDARANGVMERWPYELLMERTGQCQKVCYRAMERADRRGLIEYGVSLRTGWLTEKGKALLEHATTAASPCAPGCRHVEEDKHPSECEPRRTVSASGPCGCGSPQCTSPAPPAIHTALRVALHGEPERDATPEERAEYDRVTAPPTPAAMLGEALDHLHRASRSLEAAGHVEVALRVGYIRTEVGGLKREAEAREGTK